MVKVMDELSDYEKLRQSKISRNARRLKELGLDKGNENSPLHANKKSNKRRTVKKDVPNESSPVPILNTRRSTRKRKQVSYSSPSNEDWNDKVQLVSDDEEEDTDFENGIGQMEDSDSEPEFDTPRKIRKVSSRSYNNSSSQKGSAQDHEHVIQRTVDPTDTSGPGGISFDRAKTGRSTCRKCRESIEKQAPRVGMQAWISGRQAVTWQCVECFLTNFICVYEVSGRSRCKLSGENFAKGELKVGVRSHSATSFYKIEQYVDGSGSSAFEQVIGWVLSRWRAIMHLSPDQIARVNSTILQIEHMEGSEDFKLVDRAKFESLFSCISSQFLKAPVALNAPDICDMKRKEENHKVMPIEGPPKKDDHNLSVISLSSKVKQPKLGVKVGAKGKVEWKFAGHTCKGHLKPARETKTHCFATTHKGNEKTLAKGKLYWSLVG